MQALRRLFERLNLPWQLVAMAALAGAAMAFVAWQWGGQDAQTLAWMTAIAILVALATVWPAWRTARAHMLLAESARALVQNDAADDANLPYLAPS